MCSMKVFHLFPPSFWHVIKTISIFVTHAWTSKSKIPMLTMLTNIQHIEKKVHVTSAAAALQENTWIKIDTLSKKQVFDCMYLCPHHLLVVSRHVTRKWQYHVHVGASQYNDKLLLVELMCPKWWHLDSICWVTSVLGEDFCAVCLSSNRKWTSTTLHTNWCSRIFHCSGPFPLDCKSSLSDTINVLRKRIFNF